MGPPWIYALDSSLKLPTLHVLHFLTRFTPFNLSMALLHCILKALPSRCFPVLGGSFPSRCFPVLGGPFPQGASLSWGVLSLKALPCPGGSFPCTLSLSSKHSVNALARTPHSVNALARTPQWVHQPAAKAAAVLDLWVLTRFILPPV